MYSTFEVSASPSWARKLKLLQQVAGLDLPTEVLDLAKEGVLSVDDFSQFTLDDKEFNALQFMVDWGFRGIIVDPSKKRSRNIAAALTTVIGEKITILAQPNMIKFWKETFDRFLPNKKICYYFSKTQKLKSLFGSEDANYEADVIVTDLYSYYKDGMRTKFPSAVIIDYLESLGTFNYSWEAYVSTLVLDLNSVVFLVGLDDLKSMKNYDNPLHKIVNILWSENKTTTLLSTYQSFVMRDFLHKKGYKLETPQCLALFGVSTHLVHLRPESEFDRLQKMLAQNIRR